MGRKLTGLVFVLCGVAMMAIGGGLAAVRLGEIYQGVAADPTGGADEDELRGRTTEIVARLGVAAVGFPISSVGYFLMRGSTRRRPRGRF